MSPFFIFVLVLTVIYVIYYSALIMHDLSAKKDSHKSEEEVIDVEKMQEGDAEEPISVSEDGAGFKVGNQTYENPEDESDVTVISTEEEANKYQEKVKNEKHSTVKEECERLQESLDTIDVESTGATDAENLAKQLLNQKPGGPKIFMTRGEI